MKNNILMRNGGGRILFYILVVNVLSVSVLVEGIGINWGTFASHYLPPEKVVQLLKDNKINKVKLFEADKDILDALAGTGIDVMVAFNNGRLAEMGDLDNAKAYVKENVTAYNPKSRDGVNITMVGIGNEPFLKDYYDNYTKTTFPALKNIQKALDDAGLGNIKATVPFNGDVYMSPPDHPVPSGGQFRPAIRDSVLEIVKFLDRSKAPFMVNIYPFLALYQDSGTFPFDYAFFDGATPVQDGKASYDNVYDANLDTLVSALTLEGFGKMPIVVGEIGWPTDGHSFANATLASKFYSGLMKRLAAGKGTPLRPENTEVYMFGLLDENTKSILPGAFERHWGILTYDGQTKYELDLSGGNKKFMVGAKDVKYLTKNWCKLKDNVSDKKAIDEALSYACDRTDCTPIGKGSSCGTLDEKGNASYIFNSFFQSMNQAKGSCDFGGLGEVTDKNISEGTCLFKIQLAPVPGKSPPPGIAPAGSPGGSPGNNQGDSASPGNTIKPTMTLVLGLCLAVFSPFRIRRSISRTSLMYI